MTRLTLDAVQYLLMAKVAVQIDDAPARRLFWELLPEIIPDRATSLTVMTAAVRNETNRDVLKTLSFLPLPATFSPGMVNWQSELRSELVAAWEERLKMERERKSYYTEYASSLRGLTELERCGLPPGATCPSVLPILLNEARHLEKKREIVFTHKFEGLAILADWRPGPNVITDPATLNEWMDFWLELYQKKSADSIIMKGIAAKALLNLTETREVGKNKVLTDMETTLLKSLVMATDTISITGNLWQSIYPLRWLNWQPQKATRFPADKLAELPKTLLKKFELSCELSCQQIDMQMTREGGKVVSADLLGRAHANLLGRAGEVLNATLERLVAWDRSELLTACRIDILPRIVTSLSNYLHHCSRGDTPIAFLPNRTVCRWLIDSCVYNIKDGNKLIGQLQYHWQQEYKQQREISLPVAWEMRIRLQHAGLSTEKTPAFEKALLEAIEKEECAKVRLVLSLWRPGKDRPNRVRRQWERLWQEGLKSDSAVVSLTSAVALLRPNPDDDTDDPVVQHQKLRETLWGLPKQLRLKLSIAELMYLMRECSAANLNTVSHANANQRWQFRHKETRFCIPKGSATPVFTPITVQTIRSDRTMQRRAGNESQVDR